VATRTRTFRLLIWKRDYAGVVSQWRLFRCPDCVFGLATSAVLLYVMNMHLWLSANVGVFVWACSYAGLGSVLSRPDVRKYIAGMGKHKDSRKDPLEHAIDEIIAVDVKELQKKRAKTYNSGYSLVVTHLTTNPPVRCLNRAERTGSLVFNVLWSYVEKLIVRGFHICGNLQLLIAIKTKFYQSKPSFTFKACGPLSTN
jgi:hypothetical protein